MTASAAAAAAAAAAVVIAKWLQETGLVVGSRVCSSIGRTGGISIIARSSSRTVASECSAV